MARILLLLAIGFVIWLLFRAFFRKQVKDAAPSEPREVENMVVCARCGVNLPRGEAREEAGVFTCRDASACKPVK